MVIHRPLRSLDRPHSLFLINSALPTLPFPSPPNLSLSYTHTQPPRTCVHACTHTHTPFLIPNIRCETLNLPDLKFPSCFQLKSVWTEGLPRTPTQSSVSYNSNEASSFIVDSFSESHMTKSIHFSFLQNHFACHRLMVTVTFSAAFFFFLAPMLIVGFLICQTLG